MEEAQLCNTLCAALPELYTNVLVKAGCPRPPPVARKGEQDSQGVLPNVWQNSLRWKEKERERGKGEGESKGGKRLLKSEINKKFPVCLPCLPLFRQKTSFQIHVM